MESILKSAIRRVINSGAKDVVATVLIGKVAEEHSATEQQIKDLYAKMAPTPKADAIVAASIPAPKKKGK